jgi:hypothetical protein
VGTVVACGDVAGLRDSAALEKLGDEAVARRRGEDVGTVAVVCAAKTIWSRPRPPVPGGELAALALELGTCRRRHGHMGRGRSRRCSCGGTPERERILVEEYVPGGVHHTRVEVEAPVAAVIPRVPYEDARGGSRNELVWSRRREIWVAEAPKHAQLAVVRRDTEEELERRRRSSGAAWSSVDEVGRGDESLRPEFRRSCTVKKHATQAIVKGAKESLCLPVLLRSIGAREA